MERCISGLGLIVTIGVAWLLSTNRKKVSWKMVGFSLLFQFVFAILVLCTAPGQAFFLWLNNIVKSILDFSTKGAEFVFGSLVSDQKSFGFIFAFNILPTIIFISSLMQILYYFGVMQKIVQFVAKIFVKLMGTSGAETLNAAANIFMGHTEAPLMIKPYLEKLTKSELLTVMTAGFATISAGVLAAYAGMLQELQGAAGHLIAASLMSCPAALMMAKILMPETEQSETLGEVKLDVAKSDVNVIDAAANGGFTGLQLAINVAGMLIAFVALIAMLDACLGLIGTGINYAFHTSIVLNFETLFGTLFFPVAWLLGIPTAECTFAGNILAKHVVINEFVAYSSMSTAIHTVSPRTMIILIYAVCGFANLSSIAIQIGGIGALAPSRKQDLARIGVYALIAGLLACYQTAAIAGIMTPTTPPATPPATSYQQHMELPSAKMSLQQFVNRC